MNKKLKIVIFIVIGLAAVVVALKVFGGSSAQVPKPATGTLSTTSAVVPGNTAKPVTTAGQSSEFSALLSSVKSIDIDTSIFENNAYKSLRDYPVSLGTDIVGRQNPFAPIGVDPAGGATTGSGVVATPELQTLQPSKITANGAEFGAQMTVTDGVPVMVMFEYGISDTFGNATPPGVLGKNGTILTPVTGLAPSTLYYVRAVAAQGSNTTTGTIMTFTTLAKPVAAPKR